jgi:hypothetical protein
MEWAASKKKELVSTELYAINKMGTVLDADEYLRIF